MGLCVCQHIHESLYLKNWMQKCIDIFFLLKNNNMEQRWMLEMGKVQGNGFDRAVELLIHSYLADLFVYETIILYIL